MESQKGFTLIELLIIVAIVSLMATVIMVSVNHSRRKAKINSVKTTMKSVMTTLVSCGISYGTGSFPVAGARICDNIPNVNWPSLPENYAYVAGGNYSYNCNFQISTGGDSESNLACNCLSQKCE